MFNKDSRTLKGLKYSFSSTENVKSESTGKVPEPEVCQASGSLNAGKELEAERVSHRHSQAVAAQAGLRKAEEAALCATSCCLWDPHFGSVTFCPQVPPAAAGGRVVVLFLFSLSQI